MKAQKLNPSTDTEELANLEHKTHVFVDVWPYAPLRERRSRRSGHPRYLPVCKGMCTPQLRK